MHDRIKKKNEKWNAFNHYLSVVFSLVCQSLKRHFSFSQTYGFEHTYRTLSTLETAGLLRAQTQPSRSYNQLRKSMKLVVEDVQEQVNRDGYFKLVFFM